MRNEVPKADEGSLVENVHILHTEKGKKIIKLSFDLFMFKFFVAL